MVLSWRISGIVAAMLACVALGACRQQPASTPVGGPTTLASVAVELPADTAQFPAGPHADAVNLHCTACHSTSMVSTQPPLSAEQWKAEITKMREIYKAPVPDAAVPEILAYLVATSARQSTAPARSTP